MRYSSALFLLVFTLVVFSPASWSNIDGFMFISPLPGSCLVSRETNIILRPGGLLDPGTINRTSALAVRGSLSGTHSGETVLSDDSRTIVFSPSTPFLRGETVTVSVKRGIRTSDGADVEPVTFSFTITTTPGGVESRIPLTAGLVNLMGVNQGSHQVIRPGEGLSSILDSLPADFPPVSLLETDNPSSGGIFMDNIVFDTTIHTTTYLMILDNSGHPLSYHRTGTQSLDFMLQPNGLFTYFDVPHARFAETDTSYAVIRTFSAGNGYRADPHELRLLPNGHALLIALDPEIVRMDTIVPGGNPNATVIGNIIQELDQSQNVVFQWRSWDHFRIIDAIHENLTAPDIDYVHMNAIDIDTDGNLLLSSRHLSEITKINRQTGDIIWRLGGVHNQFTFTNDTLGFSYQHAVRRIANGNITLFDNGNFHTPPFSRALEFQVDENAMTATLAWQYRNTPDILGTAMGYVQRLDDGNTLIGWGAANPSVTEVRPDGSKALELSLPQGVFSYRAILFPWPPGTESVTGTNTAPRAFRLDQNYPNPFNPITTIRYVLSRSGYVSLSVFNTLGEQVATVVKGQEQAGEHEVVFRAEGLASGVYFCRLNAGSDVSVRKLLLLR